MDSTCRYCKAHRAAGLHDWQRRRTLANRLLMEMGIKDGKQQLGLWEQAEAVCRLNSWNDYPSSCLHAAWHICTVACPSKVSCAVFFLGSYRFASFALSLSFLHYPAPLVLVHAVSRCASSSAAWLWWEAERSCFWAWVSWAPLWVLSFFVSLWHRLCADSVTLCLGARYTGSYSHQKVPTAKQQPGPVRYSPSPQDKKDR